MRGRASGHATACEQLKLTLPRPRSINSEKFFQRLFHLLHHDQEKKVYPLTTQDHDSF